MFSCFSSSLLPCWGVVRVKSAPRGRPLVAVRAPQRVRAPWQCSHAATVQRCRGARRGRRLCHSAMRAWPGLRPTAVRWPGPQTGASVRPHVHKEKGRCLFPSAIVGTVSQPRDSSYVRSDTCVHVCVSVCPVQPSILPTRCPLHRNHHQF